MRKKLKRKIENETNVRFTEDETDPEELQGTTDKELIEETKKTLDDQYQKMTSLEREICNLTTFFNPHPETHVNEAGEMCAETGSYGAVTSGYEEPKNFSEAWNHENEHDLTLWKEAIRKEIKDMLKRGVWRHEKGRYS